VNETAARAVTDAVQIPTIGIGSGQVCDGQILVLHDMLGLNEEFKPKFLKHFAQLESLVVGAVTDYCTEVTERTFPAVK
jgi:3-methyl-2-oxobutanoate hydroxymethyltransferase